MKTRIADYADKILTVDKKQTRKMTIGEFRQTVEEAEDEVRRAIQKITRGLFLITGVKVTGVDIVIEDITCCGVLEESTVTEAKIRYVL